jgi:single-strand DNA-binding protein
LKKGQLISVIGRIQNRSWEDNEGKKRYSTDIIIEEHYFAESKKDIKPTEDNGFYPIDENDTDLPF